MLAWLYITLFPDILSNIYKSGIAIVKSYFRKWSRPYYNAVSCTVTIELDNIRFSTIIRELSKQWKFWQRYLSPVLDSRVYHLFCAKGN